MSAPGTERPASFSSTGYEDGFGRRALVFDREAGTSCDRLVLRPEFAVYEAALRTRAAALNGVPGLRAARVRRLHREIAGGALAVDTDVVPGDRLMDVLEAAAEGQEDHVLAGVDVAVGFLLEILPALHTLHTTAGIAHGAIAPGRLMLTPGGQVVLLDVLYGSVLERLAYTAARLWNEFGIAVPPTAGAARFEVADDLAQAALAALMLLLGRPLAPDEFQAGFASAQAEAVEIAQIRGSAAFASGIQAFLDRALLPGPSGGFKGADEAERFLRDLTQTAMGAAACRAALIGVAESMAELPPAREALAPAAAEIPERPPEARPAIRVAPAAAGVPANRAPGELVTAAPPPAPLEVRIEVPAPVAVAAAPPAPPPPVPVQDAERLEVVPPAPPPPVPVQNAERLEAAPAVMPAQPLPRRKRGRRGSDKLRSAAPPVDKLRSTAAPEEVTPPVQAPSQPPAPPRPPMPAPVFAPPPPPPPRPVFPESVPYGAGRAAESGSPSPYLQATDRARNAMPSSAPLTVAAPIAAPAPPIPVKAAAPLRIKAVSPGGFAPPRPPRMPRPDEPLSYPPRGAVDAPGGGFPWKIATAAIVVLLLGVAAGRAYLPERSQSVPRRTAAAPAPVPAAAAPATGTLVLTTVPAGAQVLLDGQEAGETPVTLEAVAPGRRVVTFVSTAGTVRRTIRVNAGETVTLDVPVFSGWLVVDAPIVLDVAQNGRTIGSTRENRLLLPPGKHTLTLTNADLGYRAAHVVEIEPGQERRLRVAPATPVNLNASPWAEVWIDGKRVGETPIANVAIPLGTREIVFKHPELGERTLTPTIRSGNPAAITVDLTKPGQP